MLKRIFVITLAAVMGLSALAGCGRKKDGPGYVIEQDKYLFGMGEMPNMGGGGAVDPSVTPEMVADLSIAMGAKSFRIWMHLTSVIERDRESNELRLKEDNVAKYHAFIDRLVEGGITHLTAMNHYYLYPYGFSASSGAVFPEPYTPEYEPFMLMLEECYVMLAEEFPEIQYWEPGNETNGGGRFMARPGYVDGASAEQNAEYLYTEEEQAAITADMCWYANRGIKSVNERNTLVLPGMVFTESADAATFLESVYEAIESQELPRGEGVKYADINPDNYFQVLNWHPYIGTWEEPTQNWIDANIGWYEVAKRHGDDGKKVFLTEFGYCEKSQDTEAHRQRIAENLPKVFQAIRDNMPWVETVHIFRMFDWGTAPANVSSIERSFGLFYSPNDRTHGGANPKPAALSLFRYFNGEDADPSALYAYAEEPANV